MLDAPTRSQLILASNRRWRAIFAILALLLPLSLHLLFARQGRRLMALADHGQQTSAALLAIRSGTAFYRYSFGGNSYDWNVHVDQAPYPVGSTFPIAVLPEDPSLSRPVWPYTLSQFSAERQPGIILGIPIGVFLFLALSALLCHRGVVRQLDPTPRPPRRPISAQWLGFAVALLIAGCLVIAATDGKSQAVFRTLWGEAPLGLPLIWVVLCGQLLLYAPAFWVFPALMRIVQAQLAQGGAVSKSAIIAAVFRAPPELRSARSIVLAGGTYFALLLGLWIAYTNYRGV